MGKKVTLQKLAFFREGDERSRSLKGFHTPFWGKDEIRYSVFFEGSKTLFGEEGNTPVYLEEIMLHFGR